MDRVLAPLRLVVGFFLFGLYVVLWSIVLVFLLPWRPLRIKMINHFGTVAGSTMMWLSGCKMTFEGREHFDASRPALYVSNHTSVVDLFIGMWISPVGTVGIAKKEVVYYPLLGQLYLLSGHLRIDRGNNAKAVESLRELGALVRKHHLSIWMWPEGTRSRTGRLLKLKKGVVHLALQTGLPIVPVVVSGAQRAWISNSISIAPVPIRVQALPAIDTSHWSEATLEQHLADLHAVFQAALPDDQKTLPA